jgi:hypothetical protein
MNRWDLVRRFYDVSIEFVLVYTQVPELLEKKDVYTLLYAPEWLTAWLILRVNKICNDIWVLFCFGEEIKLGSTYE